MAEVVECASPTLVAASSIGSLTLTSTNNPAELLPTFLFFGPTILEHLSTRQDAQAVHWSVLDLRRIGGHLVGAGAVWGAGWSKDPSYPGAMREGWPPC